MECSRHEFLARPGLAQDEDRGIGRSNDLDLSEHSLKRSAATNNPLKLIFGRHLIRESKSLHFRLAAQSNRSLVRSRGVRLLVFGGIAGEAGFSFIQVEHVGAVPAPI